MLASRFFQMTANTKKIPHTVRILSGICMRDQNHQMKCALQLILHISGHIIGMVGDTFQIA